MSVVQLTAWRTTEINFSANLDVPVQWSSGDFDGVNNSRVYVPSSGYAVITANAHIATLSTANLQYAGLRKNGSEIVARQHYQAGFANGEYALAWSNPVGPGDYFELIVRASSNSKVSVLIFNPNISITLIAP